MTHDVSDDARALGEAAVGTVSAVEHRVEDATVHRLEAVSHIGQCSRHDDAHRIVDVRALHLVLERDRFGAVVLGRCRISHEVSVLWIRRGFEAGKLAPQP
jgi:hypothetical protein